MKDRLEDPLFESFEVRHTVLRMIMPVMLQQTLGSELRKSTLMFTYLKRSLASRKNDRGRFVNILICSMQIIAPLMLQISLVVTITQESKLSQIIKAFATCAFVTTVDDVFAANFPQSIKENAKKLNKTKSLLVEKDHNSYTKVFKRLWKGISCKKIMTENMMTGEQERVNPLTIVFQELANLAINFWYQIVVNIQVIFYNYFIGLLCVIIQLVGSISQVYFNH